MALGDILGGIQGAANGLGNALYPTDPNMQGYVDPGVAANARNQSLIRLGLGIMQAPYSMHGGLAGGLLGAVNGADDSYQTAMDSAFKHTLLKRQADYQASDRDFLQQQHALELKTGALDLKNRERSDRSAAAQTAARVAAGLSSSPNPQAQWGLLQNDPDVKDALSTLGLQAPYTGAMADPGQFDAFRQQLATAAQAAPPQTPIKLAQGDVLIDPITKQPVASAAPKSTVEYKDAGDKLIPVNNVTGQVVQGLPPISKNLTVAQQRQVDGQTLTPEAIDLAARRLKNGEEAGKVLANFGRGAQGAANIAAVQNRFAQLAATPDANGQTMSAEDIAARIQELGGQKRTIQELAAREGKIAPRVQEAQNFARMALTASAAVPRTNWTTANKALQWGASQASDPALGRFQVANNSLINAYAAAVGGGAIHVHDQEKASQMLATTDGPDAYAAKVDQLIKETQQALAAPQQVEADMHKRTTGKDIPVPSGATDSLNANDLALVSKWGGK